MWVEGNPEGPLFSNWRDGSPNTSNGVYRLVFEYAYHEKLRNITPHILRHTFCKNAINLGVPIDQVAVMAGHSSLDITKRYTTSGMEDPYIAVERMAWE